jgi:short-subunit dehydrogenase
MPRTYGTIAITGASSGIGAALARCFAQPDVTLCLIGRHADRLVAVADECRDKGATVEIAVADVRDAVMVGHMLTKFDDRHAIDLLIANAGVSAGLSPGRLPEAEGVSRRLMEINYGGMLNTVEPLLPRFIARRRGQIALVSSLAALRPQPDLPSYSASKMAVRGYGIALRGWLKDYGIDVSLVYPGFVTSPMSARHRGAKPFEIPTDAAARHIVRKLRRRRAVIAFPFLLAAGAYLNMLLPAWASDWTNRMMRAEVDPDDGR